MSWSMKKLLRRSSMFATGLVFLLFLVETTGSEPVDPVMAIRELVLFAAVTMLFFASGERASNSEASASNR